jgi:hypothetical protein
MQTTIALEYTADGNCSIAVRGGESSRAEMSYRPQMPGRCAIPAIREEGPVTLTVLLPRGSERPRDSVPPLTWSERGGRPLGTAELEAAPEFVDIMPAREGYAAVYGWVLLAAALAMAIWVVRGRRLRRKPQP